MNRLINLINLEIKKNDNVIKIFVLFLLSANVNALSF